MDEKLLRLIEICQDRTAAVVRDKRGKLILMPYDKGEIEKNEYEKIWVGSPYAYFEDENGPKKYNALPAEMLFEQLERRILWEEKRYIGAQIALTEIRNAFLGLPSSRTINNTQKTIKEVKKLLPILKEKDRKEFLRDLKDLLVLDLEEKENKKK